jgi:hypothetical protein
MARLLHAAAVIAVALALAPVSARAQFDWIFGGPLRPPGSVPNGSRQPVPVDPPQQAPDYPPQGGGRVGLPGTVQSRPLPPPPGVAVIEPISPPGVPSQGNQSTLSGLPGGQRQPRGAPQPVDTAPQPGDEVVAEPPSQKIANKNALFSGLDKITGRVINFDVAIGETVQFGALQVTPRACYTRPPTETANTDAFVEVDEVTLQGEVKRIFTGWMFAASPGLHAVEHAIYDVWLTDCKGAAQTVAVTPADPAPTPPRAPQGQQTPQNPQRAQQQTAQPKRPPQPPQPQPPQPFR